MSQPNQPVTFDVAVCEHLKQASLIALSEHPEVRSIIIAIDYAGKLNDAEINKGIWISATGSVTKPDAIIGSLFVTHAMLEAQVQRASQYLDALRKTMESTGLEALKQHEELKAIKEQIQAFRGTVPPGTSNAGSPEASSQGS